MRVKCKKLFIPCPEGKIIYNNSAQDFLQIDKIYLVFGLSIQQDLIYYYIFDGEHLVPVPKALFVLIDDRVSKHWHFKEWEDGRITLWPGFFYEEGFIENFAERAEKERKLFYEFSKIMEEESKWVKTSA